MGHFRIDGGLQHLQQIAGGYSDEQRLLGLWYPRVFERTYNGIVGGAFRISGSMAYNQSERKPFTALMRSKRENKLVEVGVGAQLHQ